MSKEYKDTIYWIRNNIPESEILGSFCLHLLLGTEYNDIDVFMPATDDMIDTLSVPDVLEINGVYFRKSKSNYDKFEFASYKGVVAGIETNIIVLSPKVWRERKEAPIYKKFDISILHCHITDLKTLKVIKGRGCDAAIESKTVFVDSSMHKSRYTTSQRLKKYKERLPGYKFLSEL